MSHPSIVPYAFMELTETPFFLLMHMHSYMQIFVQSVRHCCRLLNETWNVSILQYQIARKSDQQFSSCYMFTVRHKSEVHCDINQHCGPQ